jgi:putative DNA primase/helicase
MRILTPARQGDMCRFLLTLDSEPLNMSTVLESDLVHSDSDTSIGSPEIIWKTEGPTDMLTVLSLELPEGHSAVCNVFGAGEDPNPADGSKQFILEHFRDQIVYVVHDCDVAGQVGATRCDRTASGRLRLGWAPAIAMVAREVRNVVLPYPIEESHGKDLRDWACERIDFHKSIGLNDSLARRATYQDLLELAAESEIIPNPDPDRAMIATEVPREERGLSTREDADGSDDSDPLEGSDDEMQFVLEAIDDPHRLARINLELYRSSFGREVAYWNESWFLWKAGQYVEITRDHFESRLNQSIKQEFDRVWQEETESYQAWKDSEKYDEAKDKGAPVCRKVTASLVKNALDATRSQCFISSTVKMHSWLDERHNGDDYVAVENGMLNLSALLAGEEDIDEILTPHDPNWFSTAKLPYKFDPEAECPAWEKFLDDVFSGDQESITALQMWFGYLLTTDMSLQKILFIIGPTRSGKGTIITVLRELLGQQAVGTPTLSSLGQQYGLVSLIGKTAAIIADARMPNRADDSIITERLLNISGGDPVDIQRKYKTDLENFKLSCRFTLFSNLLPRLRDTSAVLVNRCIFLAMPNSYLGKEDRGLQGRLLAEMSGILNWAIIGREALKSVGKITQPTSGYSLLNELQSILSPVSMFLEDCCEIDKDAEVRTKELFYQWEIWCNENDISHTGDVQSFARKLKAVLPSLDTKQKRTALGDRSRYFVGLQIGTRK